MLGRADERPEKHPPSLFREGAWDNAYEIVARMAWRMLTGSG